MDGRRFLGALVVAALLAAVPAAAQTSPTMESLVRNKAIRLAVADDAPPFSWIGEDGVSTGYTVDLCRRVAADAASALGWTVAEPDTAPSARSLQLQFVHLPTGDEPGAVASGAADLGCSGVVPAPGTVLGASRPVALSQIRLLATRAGDVSSVGDLAGRTVAVVGNTSAAAVLADLAPTLSPPARVQVVPGVGDGYELLATGGVDAFAAGDLHLAGLLATRTDSSTLRIVGRGLPGEFLAIRFRANDPGFAALVARSFRRMAADGTLRALYAHWFPTPPPPALGLGG